LNRNLLILLTDQERAPGLWDPPGMARFHAENLPARARLRESGLDFRQHRIASAACVPSRVSLWTGLPPHEHGVWQTDGFAKLADDPDMRWLAPDGPRTLGHRVREAGIRATYLGKWHLSDPQDGLTPWGFEGWRGPEPHGADPKNAGCARDATFVEQAKAFLRANDGERFVLVVSLVNPHDIVFFPAWSLYGGPEGGTGLGPMGAGPTDTQDPAELSEALQAYRRAYPRAYGPAPIVRWLYRRNPDAYRRMYCGLLARTDQLLDQLLDTLDETGLAKDTAVLWTSDHGEMLGSHGGLHQKWYSAYDEVLRVPMVVRDPSTGASGPRDLLTSHLDLAPTGLGLLGLDHDLPGVDLRTATSRDSWFETRDDILEGSTPHGAFTRRFPAVGSVWRMRYRGLQVAERAVRALITRDEERAIWKMVYCYAPDSPRSGVFQLFCITRDPTERTDLWPEMQATVWGRALRDRVLSRPR